MYVFVMRLGYFSFASYNTPSILCIGNIFTLIHDGVLLFFLSVCYSVGLFGWAPFSISLENFLLCFPEDILYAFAMVFFTISQD